MVALLADSYDLLAELATLAWKRESPGNVFYAAINRLTLKSSSFRPVPMRVRRSESNTASTPMRI